MAPSAAPTKGRLLGEVSGEQDAFVRVLDADGRTVWTRQFGSKDCEDTTGVAVDGAGGIYVVGLTGGRMAGADTGGSFLRKLEPDGAHAWTTQFGAKESGWAYAVGAHESDSVLVGGMSHGTMGPSTTDAFVRKYAPDAPPAAHDAMLRVRDPDAAGAEADPEIGFFSRAGSMRKLYEREAASLLPDGRVFVVNGFGPSGLWDPATRADDDAYASAEVWDPVTEAFTHAGSMAKIRWVDSVTLLSDGHVLVVGAGDADGAIAEVWAPTAPEKGTGPLAT